jgi:ABC-type glycerol-3-phosphate transport system substrate-binding protein
MLKMKSSLSVVLVMSLLLSSFFVWSFSLQKVYAAGNPITIKVAFMAGYLPEAKGGVKWGEQIFKKFEDENPDIKIQLIAVPLSGGGSGWNEYFTKIQTMAAAGNAPDVFHVAIEGIQAMVKLGLARPLDDYLDKHPAEKEEAIKDIHPNLLKPFIIKGKLYSLVHDWNNVVMHFNMKLLKQAGLGVPPSNWTLKMFLDYCKKLTNPAKGQYAFTIPNYYFGFSAWLINNDTNFLTPDMKGVIFDSPKTIEVLQLMHDLVHKYKYAPVPQPNVDSILQLVEGKIAMGCWGRWPTTTYVNNNFKDVAIQLLPKLKTQKVIFGSGGGVVYSGTKNYEQAAKVAVWMASPYFMKNFYGVGNIPTRKSVADEVIPALGIPKNYQLYYKSADIAVPVQSPPAYSEIASIFDRYMSGILSGEMKPEDAAKKAAAEMRDALAKNPTEF